MERQPITKAGYDKIAGEIKHLEEVEMPRIGEKIAEARAEGDLSENAEYHGQRENQGRVQAKINQLKSKLSGCYIVSDSEIDTSKIGFGCVVRVEDLEYGDEEAYELVGPGEEDYSSDPMKILTSSPVAQAMLGKAVGDTVTAQTPNGELQLKVLSIEAAGA